MFYFIADSVKFNDQTLFLEIRKVEELAEDNVVEFDWLASLLTELFETTFDWISGNQEIWMTYDNEETNDQHSDRLTQVRVFFNKSAILCQIISASIQSSCTNSCLHNSLPLTCNFLSK